MKKKIIVFVVFVLVLNLMFNAILVSAHDSCIHSEGICSCLDTSSNKIISTEQKKICDADTDDEFLIDEIMVVLNNSVSLELKSYTKNDFSEVGCLEVQDLTSSYLTRIREGKTARSRSSLGVNLSTFNQILRLKIQCNDKGKLLSAIRVLESRDDVISAEPVYTNMTWAAIPNDPEYLESVDNRWAYEKIGMPMAWNLSTGNYSVTVGVIDTGIDITSVDLSSQVNQTLSRKFTEDGASPYEDIEYHGTCVASIIGAKGNNSYGTTGVCWNVTLASLKADRYEEDEYGNYYSVPDMTAIISAINYANQCNIPILNLSAIHIGPAPSGLYEAIQNYNGLFICGAGNYGMNNDEAEVYPANFRLPNLISVGSSNKSDNKSNFSHSGQETVDIFAPGEQIHCTATVYGEVCFDSVSGTSFAAPFVTGVAALLLAKYPNLTASELKQTIMLNVDDADDGITAFTNDSVSGGRINAYKAMTNPHFHSLTYTSNNSSSHIVTCSTCSYQETESHDNMYTPWEDNKTHQAVCTLCNYTRRYFHNWNAYASDGVTLMCTQCGALYVATDDDED